ncbi:MAG: hypothetical protein HY812_18060 [Planctomycetes bacterium]|nr:hypothetical protein [Planctomycetota bacterium]
MRSKVMAALAAAAAVLVWSGVALAQDKAEDDVLLRALKDEMARTLSRLQLSDMDRPYYVAYAAQSGAGFSTGASLGALAHESEGPVRSLSVEVRVGDYVLDSSGGSYFFGRFGGGLCLEDNYDSIRFRLWLSTDSEYKDALERLTRKKADLKSRVVQDRPDDFSREDPVTLIQARSNLALDRTRWPAAVKAVSAVFREAPELQRGQATFQGVAADKYLLSNEDFLLRTCRIKASFSLSADTQAVDGMPLGDSDRFLGRTDGDLPADEALIARARKMVDHLLALREAPKAEDYTGPVLFEGIAAASVFREVLASGLRGTRESDEGRSGRSGLADKIGKRVLARFMHVTDDPSRTEFQGKPLFGCYQVDDEGVKTSALKLVENGKLLALYSTRTPTKQVKRSNGHCRGGQAAAGNLFIEASVTLPPQQLKERLIELVKDEGLPYGILARRMGEVYRVYADDGREELIRGASFGALQPRLLRDIVAAGADAAPYHYDLGDSMMTLVVPSILVEELDMAKPPESFPKTPYLGSPLGG